MWGLIPSSLVRFETVIPRRLVRQPPRFSDGAGNGGRILSHKPSLQRHLVSCLGQRRNDALPQAGGAPQPIPFVRRLPFAVLLRHRPPRGPGAHHPQDAAEHGAVVVARSAFRRLLRWESGRNAEPLGGAESGIGRRGRRGSAGGRPGRSPIRPPRGGAAGGDRLVGPPPPRPVDPERPALRGVAHREHQPAHLRHRERDQAGNGTPLVPRSSARAA